MGDILGPGPDQPGSPGNHRWLRMETRGPAAGRPALLTKTRPVGRVFRLYPTEANAATCDSWASLAHRPPHQRHHGNHHPARICIQVTPRLRMQLRAHPVRAKTSRYYDVSPWTACRHVRIYCILCTPTYATQTTHHDYAVSSAEQSARARRALGFVVSGAPGRADLLVNPP